MGTPTYFVILGAVVALALLVVAWLVVRRLRDQLAALQAQVGELHAELAELRRTRPVVAPPVDYLVPEPLAAPGSDDDPLSSRPVPDQLVLSATLGEPLVRTVAFAHGLRRALSAESRHRIRFAVRREVRRARKQRRTETKAAYRRMQQQVGEA